MVAQLRRHARSGRPSLCAPTGFLGTWLVVGGSSRGVGDVGSRYRKGRGGVGGRVWVGRSRMQGGKGGIRSRNGEGREEREE